MSVQDSESRRFELACGNVFLRRILAQGLPRNIFFVFFLLLTSKKKNVLIASGKEILWRISLKFKVFFGNIVVSIVIGLKCFFVLFHLFCCCIYFYVIRFCLSYLTSGSVPLEPRSLSHTFYHRVSHTRAESFFLSKTYRSVLAPSWLWRIRVFFVELAPPQIGVLRSDLCRRIR